MNRSEKTARFMDDSDLDALSEWVDNLTSPGVLVIGSPIFWPPVGLVDIDKYVPWWKVALLALVPGVGVAAAVTLEALVRAIDDKLISDRNLQAYHQFEKLSRSLTGSPHDILILTGDIHYGRASSVRVDMKDRASDPTRIFEIVSSPLSLLPGAEPGREEIEKPSVPFVGSADNEALDVDRYLADRCEKANPVQVREVVARGRRRDRVHEHFATAQFSLNPDRSVRVRVDWWSTIDGTRVGRDHFVLDGGRSVPGAKQNRLVTHVVTDGTGAIVGLGGWNQEWSPRAIEQVKSDIETAAAVYHCYGNRIGVVHSASARRGFYLRAGADNTSTNNLRALPHLPTRESES